VAYLFSGSQVIAEYASGSAPAALTNGLPCINYLCRWNDSVSDRGK
jgi:hypothetical protein